LSKKEHDADVAAYRKTVHTFDKPWYRSGLRLIEKHALSGLVCLDLCSGNCEFSQLLRDKRRMEMTCADYIPSHLDRASALGFDHFSLDLDGDASVVDAIAHKNRERYDMVVNLAAIEHVFNSDNLLRFAHTALKPNGYLLVNTPNIAFIGYRVYSLLGGNRPFGDGHHVRFWDFRFLQTNLYLNGFDVIDDFRRFYTVPSDVMARAFRNKRALSRLASLLFYACHPLQRLSFARGWFTDELTVLCRKEAVPPVGFELTTVKRTLAQLERQGRAAKAVARLKEARRRGWLDEHLYLGRMVDGL
jgi:SAM-dependent methyltransferase